MCKELQTFLRFSLRKLPLDSQDLLHCRVLHLLGLPAPLVTPADQGPLLLYLVLSYNRKSLLEELLGSRTLNLGMVNQQRGSYSASASLITLNQSGRQTCSALSLAQGSPGKIFCLCQIGLYLKRPCMMGQQKRGQVTSPCFPSLPILLSLSRA